MDLDYIKIIVTIVLAVIGWMVGNYFTTRRDVANKRRELVITHLIEAYHIITNEVSHREESEERNLKLEHLLSDIQLFGSQEQIAIVKQLADDVAAGGVFELNPLIASLRNDLRKQLNLPEISGNIKWLRFNAPTL
ncbi:MAG: hypothetical protein ACW7DS_14275 [Paraglaciecola chathamensis]|uniref:hypothetical protein n=1 Tax=Neptunomonas phycophila TaxID=1572645 RepID=UPI0015BAF8E7|nr:hypothetical protein [Neptunomonas phycophila]QLE98807.1 hypothetical protein FLM49_14880 [Neptunomonas phycophila]